MMISEDLAETIVDPRAYQDRSRSDEAFKRLRAESPLAVAQPPGFDPFWVVTRFDDIQAVEKQNELFHNGDRSTVITTIEADKKVRAMMGGSPHLVRSLVQMDNPDHFAYRRLTQAWFLPQNLRGLEARIREIARGFVDRMAAKARGSLASMSGPPRPSPPLRSSATGSRPARRIASRSRSARVLA